MVWFGVHLYKQTLDLRKESVTKLLSQTGLIDV